MSAIKYRPYFTLSDLKHIQQCMLAVKQQVQVDQNVLRYLHKYISDIESGFRQANHITKPSLTEKLGFVTDTTNKEPTDEEVAAAMKLLNSMIGE